MKSLILAAVLALAWPATSYAADPTHYRINAKFDLENGRLAVDAELSISVTPDDHNAIFLLGSSNVVMAATADHGASVSIKPGANPKAPQMIVIDAPALAGEMTLRLRYEGKLSDTGGVSALAPDRIELSADSLWYPLSTNFNAHFAVDAKISGIPADFVIVSADEVRRTGSVMVLKRVRPSLDIAFSAAPRLHHANLGALDVYAADLSSKRVSGYLENGPLAVDFLQRWYGALPTKRVAVAVVNRANGTGYSRPGYIVVADTAGAVSNEIWARAGYIAHEISHAWWSNADFTSEDYWLVESTAEYSALRYIESRYDAQTRQRMLDAKNTRAAKAGPLIGKGRASGDSVYAKGPLLLFKLEAKIGRAKLDAILADLAVRKQITTRAFLDALTQVTGADAANDFEHQLRE